MRDKLLRYGYLSACLALIGVGLVLWLWRPAPSAAASADVQPEAQALLDEVAKTYQALPGYADHGEFTFAITVNGETQAQNTPLALAFERPDKLAFATETIRLTSDGQTLATTNAALKKYMTQKAPETITPESILGGPLGAMLGGSPAAAPVLVVLEMLTDDAPVATLTESAESVRLDDDRMVEGRTLRAVFITQANGSGLRLLIDPESKLLKRIEMVVPDEQLAAKAPPGTKLDDLSIAWSSGAIATTSPGAEAFAFNPPAGFTEMKAAEAAAPAAGAAGKNALVGQPAPDFAYQAIQGDSTRKVSRDDLKGKVVLLDFWATWCPPCREELPEIQALAQRLAKRADAEKVAVVAVSQDRPEADDAALKKLVESTLAELNVGGLLTGKVASVGLDADQAVGDAFGVQGIPTLVLLDADGVVQAVHVGYKPGIGEEMEAEMVKLLAK